MSNIYGGLSANNFISDADTRVSYSDNITKGVTAKSQIKPFIS